MDHGRRGVRRLKIGKHLGEHRHQAAVAGFTQMIVIDIQRQPVTAAIAVLLVTQIRQRVQNMRAALAGRLILQPPDEGMTLAVLLAGDEHLMRQAALHRPTDGLGHIDRHFRHRPDQIQRAMLCQLADRIQIVLAELGLK
ncbi:hypothetical protein D3C81_1761400 [compost metagenome]